MTFSPIRFIIKSSIGSGSDTNMNPSIIDYIAGNYISLILLVGLTVIITLNKDAKIPAVGSVYLILLLAFAVIYLKW